MSAELHLRNSALVWWRISNFTALFRNLQFLLCFQTYLPLFPNFRSLFILGSSLFSQDTRLLPFSSYLFFQFPPTVKILLIIFKASILPIHEAVFDDTLSQYCPQIILLALEPFLKMICLNTFPHHSPCFSHPRNWISRCWVTYPRRLLALCSPFLAGLLRYYSLVFNLLLN